MVSHNQLGTCRNSVKVNKTIPPWGGGVYRLRFKSNEIQEQDTWDRIRSRVARVTVVVVVVVVVVVEVAVVV